MDFVLAFFPDYFFMNWSHCSHRRRQHLYPRLQSSFPQSAKAVTASKAISFRQLETGLGNLIGKKSIVDARWMEFPGRSVFIK